jgi:hypothetical protein
MEEKREWKGIWIPKEIWLNKELSLFEKILLIEISSLDNDFGCIATNEYFGEFFDKTPERISQVISNLVKKEFIFSTIKDNYKRTIKINKVKYFNIDTATNKHIENTNNNTQKMISPNTDQKIDKNDIQDSNNKENNTDQTYLKNKNQTEEDINFIKNRLSNETEIVKDSLKSFLKHSLKPENKQKTINLTKECIEKFDIGIKEVKQTQQSFLENIINIANETIADSMTQQQKENFINKKHHKKEDIIELLQIRGNRIDNLLVTKAGFCREIENVYNQYNQQLKDNGIDFIALFKSNIATDLVAKGYFKLTSFKLDFFVNKIQQAINDNKIQLKDENKQDLNQIHIANMLGCFIVTGEIFYDFKNQQLYKDIEMTIKSKINNFTYFDFIFFFQRIHSFYKKSKLEKKYNIVNSLCKDLANIYKDNELNERYLDKIEFLFKTPLISYDDTTFNNCIYKEIISLVLEKNTTELIKKFNEYIIKINNNIKKNKHEKELQRLEEEKKKRDEIVLKNKLQKEKEITESEIKIKYFDNLELIKNQLKRTGILLKDYDDFIKDCLAKNIEVENIALQIKEKHKNNIIKILKDKNIDYKKYKKKIDNCISKGYNVSLIEKIIFENENE